MRASSIDDAHRKRSATRRNPTQPRAAATFEHCIACPIRKHADPITCAPPGDSVLPSTAPNDTTLPPSRPKLPTKESITQRAAWPTRFGPRHHDVAVPGGLDKARRETVMVGIRNRVRLTIEAAQNSPVWPVLPGSRHGEDRRWARCAIATLFQRRFLDMLALYRRLHHVPRSADLHSYDVHYIVNQVFSWQATSSTPLRGPCSTLLRPVHTWP